MFDYESFLARLAEAGITVTADGDSLKVRGSNHAPLSEADRAMLLANKPVLLEQLRRYRTFRVHGPGVDATMVGEPCTLTEAQRCCWAKFGRVDLVIEPVRHEGSRHD